MRIENSIGAPAHLDGSFFEDVLENGLCEANVRTKDISLALGSGGGENYCSDIYRAKVKYQRDGQDETDQVSVIVKSMPLQEDLSFLVELNVYHKEKLFYLNILPKLEILLDSTKLAPKCYLAQKKPVCTIAFEDMSADGFVMADREVGLDETHTKMVLRKLGKFHAVSMVYAQKEPEMMNHFQGGLLDPKGMGPSSMLFKLLKKYLGYEIKLVSQWKGFERIAEKLQEFHRNFQTRLVACQAPKKGELKVLNHGDFWVNNMLFKYDDKTPTDVVFIDFQLSVFGSPGIDLNYFLYASVQLDVLKKTDMLLRTYYDALSETLQELRYDKIPTYSEIVYEFEQKAAYGLFTMFGPLPIMRMDRTKCDGNSFENLVEGDDSEEKMEVAFSSKTVIEQLRYSLQVLDKRGGLDP